MCFYRQEENFILKHHKNLIHYHNGLEECMEPIFFDLRLSSCESAEHDYASCGSLINDLL